MSAKTRMIKSFNCDKCSFSCKTKPTLARHMTIKHWLLKEKDENKERSTGTTKPYQTVKSVRQTKRKSKQSESDVEKCDENIMRNKLKEKQQESSEYTCDTCGFKATNKSTLKTFKTK